MKSAFTHWANLEAARDDSSTAFDSIILFSQNLGVILSRTNMLILDVYACGSGCLSPSSSKVHKYSVDIGTQLSRYQVFCG